MKVGAAESISHLERALSLWDSVPEADMLVGRSKVEWSSPWHGPSSTRATVSVARLTRRARDMLDAHTPALVASRAHAALPSPP